MGGVQSIIPQADPSQPFFNLFFHIPDTIKIVLADKETIEIVRNACLNRWQRGFQMDSYDEDGSYHLKFVGNPFSKLGSSDDAINAKIVAIGILSDLYQAGWDFVLSSDLTRFQDLSTWFFQRVTTSKRPITPGTIICLSLSSTDGLQLIGADRSMSEILRSAVQQSYEPGIQDERLQWIGGQCYELKLRGRPWATCSMSEGLFARRMLLEIVRQFHKGQYRLHASADLKGTADCLFFIRQPNVDTTPDRFSMISLNANDRLRLIDCPRDVIDTTRQTIVNGWSGGLQNETNLGCGSLGSQETWEFQMRGCPWWANGADTVLSRSFLTNLFYTLLQRGWCLVSALDISRRDDDKAVFLLRSCPPSQLPHFCMSLNETDKIRLIGASSDVVDTVRRVIAANWSKGLDRECEYYGSLELKLNGNPWSPFSSNESCLARVMMTRMLAALAQLGWRVIGSADVSAKYHRQDNGPDYPIDVHSWFLAFTGVSRVPTVTVNGPVLPGVVPPGSGYDLPPPSYDEVVQ